MITAASWRKITLDLSAEYHESGVVSRAMGCRDQGQCSVNSRVEFCFLFDACSHESSRIESNQDCLISLDLILACCELSASRRGGPGNMSQLVSTNIITHRFKLPTFSAPRSLAMS